MESLPLFPDNIRKLLVTMVSSAGSNDCQWCKSKKISVGSVDEDDDDPRLKPWFSATRINESLEKMCWKSDSTLPLQLSTKSLSDRWICGAKLIAASTRYWMAAFNCRTVSSRKDIAAVMDGSVVIWKSEKYALLPYASTSCWFQMIKDEWKKKTSKKETSPYIFLEEWVHET